VNARAASGFGAGPLACVPAIGGAGAPAFTKQAVTGAGGWKPNEGPCAKPGPDGPPKCQNTGP
jgi:hypothetical protein